MRVLLVDNYDSFTYNLAQLLESSGAEVVVLRNDTPLGELVGLNVERVVLSPGPGGPEDSGVCGDLLRALQGKVPILGVCLGMQVIAAAHGGTVERAPRAVHGRASALEHDGESLFRDLPQGFAVGRYHSLCVQPGSLPEELRATAWSDGVLMGLRNQDLPVWGIQFHPESILSECGSQLMENFLGGASR